MSDPFLQDAVDSAQSKPAHAPAPAAESNPLRWVHYAMRGRYHWALLLGLVFAAGLGYYMYDRVVPQYQTTGMIQIRSYLPRLLYGNEATGKMPNFEGFMDAQIRVLRNDRVSDMAMSSEAWRALNRPFTPESQEDFRDSLQAYRSGGGDILVVTFNDPDPKASQVAVKAVIEAYQRLFNETDPTQEQRRMQLLDQRRVSLANQRNSLRSQIASFGDAYGPDGVKFRYQQAMTDLQSAETQARANQMKIAEIDKRLAQGPPLPTIDQLATDIPRLADLKSQIDNRKLRLAMLRRDHDADSPSVVDLESRIQHVQQMIDDMIASIDLTAFEKKWREGLKADKADLQIEQDRLATSLKQAKAQLTSVAQEKTRLDRLEDQAQDINSKYQQVQSRVDQLNVESAMGDRLEVLSYGRVTPDPINEDEPMRKAGIGAIAGVSVGVCLVAVIGMMNPTLRRSDDVSISQGAPKVLGMLPHLPERLTNAEQAYFAGQCVHQIRMFLQLEGGGADLRSFVITGPAANAGKTSLTMALGFSYAAAGARTLLVDFDMVGAGLTSRLDQGRHKRLGRLLREQGLVSAADLDRAIQQDPDPNRPLGEKLIDQGMVSQDDVSRVLDLQQQSRVGLLDVLAGEPLEACIVDLPAENLSLLSVGNATADHISRVGRAAVKRFLHDVGQKYDVVLIDTGPVPGSVEASLIAAEADRVVLAVSKGDQMRRLNECQSFLRSVGARVAGVVFNRAESRDMARSTHSLGSSVRSASIDRRDERAPGLRRVGPVAVATVGGDLYNSQSTNGEG